MSLPLLVQDQSQVLCGWFNIDPISEREEETSQAGVTVSTPPTTVLHHHELLVIVDGARVVGVREPLT
uniref:Uncharacterized protein n=1 Tax=Brassica oleracea TaxID=3712 RepID=A0A3P6G6S9_BRAOL|nr:unnamed protein product [Brassica oleracea]